MKVKSWVFVLVLLSPAMASAEWVDFEDLTLGEEFNYKPYYSQEFEFKASRYFEGGSLFYYDFKIAANLGDSNYSENFLAIDTGSLHCLPGISVMHKEKQAFDFYAFDVGRLYDHDGEFSISLLALNAQGKVLAQQQIHISEGLRRIELGDKFRNMTELLINAVYVDDLDDSVARFALDNMDLSVSGGYRQSPVKTKKIGMRIAMRN